MKGDEQFVQDVRDAIAATAPDNSLKVEEAAIYLGANPLTRRPTVAFRIQVNPAGFSAAKMRQVLEARLGVELAPGRFANAGSPSTQAAYLIAAAAAALLTRELDVETDYGACPAGGDSAHCWIEFLVGTPAGVALKAALVEAAAAMGGNKGGEASAELNLKRLAELCALSRPNKESTFLIAAARARDLPYAPFARSRIIWQFGWGRRGRVFLSAACNDDGYVGFNVAKVKGTAKFLFRELGLPTPRWSELAPDGDPAQSLARVGFPCVVKPVDGSSGDGVTANIRTNAEYQAAVAHARGKSNRRLLVEAHHAGDDHRLMVVDGQLIAAVRREAPVVIGDGVSTIKGLVERLNASRQGPPEEVGFLTPVEIDSALLLRLQNHGIALDHILPEGTVYALRSAANFSVGGSAFDVTERVHPQVRAWAEQLARTIGLRVTGIDYVTPDIAAHPAKAEGAFIEINSTPDLHILAAAGLDRVAIAKAVLGKDPGRIPVDLVLVDRQQTEDTIAALPRMAGHAIAWATGMELDGSMIDAKGLSCFDIAVATLRNSLVESATFVWSIEDMTHFGLPVDRIRQTTIVGAAPDDQWHALLKRISKKLTVNNGRRVAGPLLQSC